MAGYVVSKLRTPPRPHFSFARGGKTPPPGPFGATENLWTWARSGPINPKLASGQSKGAP
jgi:hypothetical protein